MTVPWVGSGDGGKRAREREEGIKGNRGRRKAAGSVDKRQGREERRRAVDLLGGEEDGGRRGGGGGGLLITAVKESLV